ncbi:unnamed protein product [Leptosia nina]|uniref:Secreted protein n=1 Tax=Leptosia nina TaxID=320188 RepID=A0AAV1J6A3_9NEOP
MRAISGAGAAAGAAASTRGITSGAPRPPLAPPVSSRQLERATHSDASCTRRSNGGKTPAVFRSTHRTSARFEFEFRTRVSSL